MIGSGTLRSIDEDGFMLEPRPGRPVHGSFHGDGEFTWEALPALPVEPARRTVVSDRDGFAWQRNGRAEESDTPWYCAAANEHDRDWATLNADRGPLMVLVPDPFGEPVDLPWAGDRASVEHAKGLPRPVVIRTHGPGREHLNVEDARGAARALWLAANQADAEG